MRPPTIAKETGWISRQFTVDYGLRSWGNFDRTVCEFHKNAPLFTHTTTESSRKRRKGKRSQSQAAKEVRVANNLAAMTCENPQVKI